MIKLNSFVAGCLLLVILIGGCSPAPVHRGGEINPATQTDPEASGEPGWWYARFSIDWPEHSDPDWSMDPLIADLVIRPVLDQFPVSIRLWRFHRRAGRDAAGHQFSFIFYTDTDVAGRVFSIIKTNALLKQLQDRKLVQFQDVLVTGINPDPRVEATSDPGWPEALQLAWPHYIMGVSAAWLELIKQQVNGASGTPGVDPDELRKRYQEINQAISGLWSREGQHAFLHHLNAIFGYEPLQIRY